MPPGFILLALRGNVFMHAISSCALLKCMEHTNNEALKKPVGLARTGTIQLSLASRPVCRWHSVQMRKNYTHTQLAQLTRAHNMEPAECMDCMTHFTFSLRK